MSKFLCLRNWSQLLRIQTHYCFYLLKRFLLIALLSKQMSFCCFCSSCLKAMSKSATKKKQRSNYRSLYSKYLGIEWKYHAKFHVRIFHQPFCAMALLIMESVTQGWSTEAQIRRCEVRILMGTQNIFFVPRSWQEKKASLTTSLASWEIYHLFHSIQNFSVIRPLYQGLSNRKELYVPLMGCSSEGERLCDKNGMLKSISIESRCQGRELVRKTLLQIFILSS